jgi:hypothetical protein
MEITVIALQKPLAHSKAFLVFLKQEKLILKLGMKYLEFMLQLQK